MQILQHCRPQDSGRGQESIAAEIQQMSESLSAKKVGIGLRRNWRTGKKCSSFGLFQNVPEDLVPEHTMDDQVVRSS
jgi:hypothetical protein